MATRADTLEVLTFLASSYNYKDLNEAAIRAWVLTFQDVPRLWLARIALRWVAAEKWFPKIGEIRYLVDRGLRGAHISKGNRVDIISPEDWSPPRSPRDEAAMWLCFIRGIGPDELTLQDLAKLPPYEEIAPQIELEVA